MLGSGDIYVLPLGRFHFVLFLPLHLFIQPFRLYPKGVRDLRQRTEFAFMYSVIRHRPLDSCYRKPRFIAKAANSLVFLFINSLILLLNIYTSKIFCNFIRKHIDLFCNSILKQNQRKGNNQNSPRKCRYHYRGPNHKNLAVGVCYGYLADYRFSRYSQASRH